MVRSNHCLTIYIVAEESGISKTTCHEILSENFGVLHVAAKFVPPLLGEDQKQNHIDVSKDLANCANADDNIFHNGSQKLHPDPKKLSKFVPM